MRYYPRDVYVPAEADPTHWIELVRYELAPDLGTSINHSVLFRRPDGKYVVAHVLAGQYDSSKKWVEWSEVHDDYQAAVSAWVVNTAMYVPGAVPE